MFLSPRIGLLFASLMEITLAMGSSPHPQVVHYTANFDSYPFQLVGVRPTNEYDGIQWTGSVVATTDLMLAGVEPHSDKNSALWTLDSTLLAGTPGIFSMDAAYTGSVTKTFNLESLWYGCIIPGRQGLIAVPTACTITVTGHSSDGSVVAKHDLSYEATGLPKSFMKHARLPREFRGLGKVTFETNSLLVAGTIDDVEYTVTMD